MSNLAEHEQKWREIQANRQTLVLQDILSNYPSPRHRQLLQRAALDVGIPEILLTSLYMVENSRRPWYFRFLEKVALKLNVWLYRVLGVPIADLSVGLCQVRISTAAELSGITFQRNGTLLRFSKDTSQRPGVISALESFLQPEVNIELAALYTARLVREYWKGADWKATLGEGLPRGVVAYLGRRYNGLEEDHTCADDELLTYPGVLNMVVEHLRARNSVEGR